MTNTRKAIEKTWEEEAKKHIGDGSVEGDVFENGVVNLEDGSLTVTGDVKDGAKIKLTLSKAFQDKMEEKRNQVSLAGVSSGVNLMDDYDEIHVGRVNIGNRMVTNDLVRIKLDGRYIITPIIGSAYEEYAGISHLSGVSFGTRPIQIPTYPGLATLRIDGKDYQGKEIIVNGENVFIDGKKLAIPEPKGPPKLVIYGNVGHNVSIESEVEIEIRGTIGNFCNIQSYQSKISAQQVGEETKLAAKYAIACGAVHKSSELKSMHGPIHAKSLGDYVEVTTTPGGNVTVQDAIANNVIITAGGHVEVSALGNHNLIESANGHVTFSQAGNHNSITASHEIKAHSIGNDSLIKSQHQGVNIHDVGERTRIQANLDINVTGLCADPQLCRSTYGRVYGRVTVAPQAVSRSSTAAMLAGALASGAVPECKAGHTLHKYTNATKAYVDSFTRKALNNIESIKQLTLLPEESDPFEKYLDPITAEVPNIPVRLNGRAYDLQTLLNLEEKKKEGEGEGLRVDPMSRDEFYIRDIQPAPDVQEAIEGTIALLKARSAVQSKAEAEAEALRPEEEPGNKLMLGL